MIVMTRQRKKEFNKKNFFHQARPKRFNLIKTRCENARNGQNAQKLNIDPKR